MAFRSGVVADFPVKKKKTVVKDRWFYYFYIESAKNILIKRRDEEGIWKGLYDFPLVESEKLEEMSDVIDGFLKDHKIRKSAQLVSVSDEYIHVLSHRKIHARFIHLRLADEWHKRPAVYLSIPLRKIGMYGVPRLIERYLQSENRKA